MAEDKIPKGRIRRSAKLGTAMGTQATRYAGTRAANVARGSEKAERALEGRHLETAVKMASILGEMKGAAMKIGQLASFIDTEFLPPEYAELYQEQLAKLRTSAPAMPWDKVSKVLEEEYLGEPLDELFENIEEDAFAAASIGQVHRATLHDGRAVAVKIQYPGIAEALESDLRNAGMIMRLARAIAPGLDAKAVAAELRLRVMEELDYEYEAQSHRSFARAYRGHPFIHVPDVLTRLSRRRVLVTEYVEGMGFEQVKAAAAGGAEPLRGDRLPLLLRLDLPPADVQRRRPPRQLHPHGRRPGRVPRLRHDQAARRRADRARAAGDRRRVAARPRGAARGAARARVRQEPVQVRRRAADGPRDGGRRLVHGGPRDRARRRSA